MEAPKKLIVRLNPLNDYLFLKIMGEKGDEDQLLGFLNAVLPRKGRQAIASVEIIENRTITAKVSVTSFSLRSVCG
jgi:hypothetical protein